MHCGILRQGVAWETPVGKGMTVNDGSTHAARFRHQLLECEGSFHSGRKTNGPDSDRE